MSLISDLKKIGLSEKSAKVYLSVLELGQASVQDIAVRADLKRSTVYVILDELIKAGLCGTVNENNKTFFTASDPEAIQSMIEIQKKELEEKLDYFARIKESLVLLKNKTVKNQPVVSFYEGRDGLLNSALEINREAIKSAEAGNKETFSIYPLDRLFDYLSDPKVASSRDRNRARRRQNGISAKVICNSQKLKEYRDDLDKYSVLDAKKNPIEADINIAGDIVRITTWNQENSAIIIRKKEVAETLRTLFRLAWLGAEAERRTGRIKNKK